MDQVHYTSPCGWRIIIYLYLILDWLLLGYQDEFSVVQWLNCMISSQCRLDTFFLYRYLSFGRSWCSGDLWFPFLANYGARCLDFGALQKIARLKSCLELLIQQLPIKKKTSRQLNTLLQLCFFFCPNAPQRWSGLWLFVETVPRQLLSFFHQPCTQPRAIRLLPPHRPPPLPPLPCSCHFPSASLSNGYKFSSVMG